ncbi:DUF6234 family protein, partial [Streptomyces gardneri]|uniref:DUF6234 family protein n=1 Tax=Streptomyces gardneri TaxID=66892 RepID=UPI0036C76238
MTTSPPPVRPAGDALFGILLLVLEGVLVLIAAFTLGMRGWAASYDPRPAGPPPMDWVPVLVFGAITGGALLLAWSMLRGGWPWTAGGQFLAAALLGIGTLVFGIQEWARAHPAPRGGPAPPPPPPTRAGGRPRGGAGGGAGGGYTPRGGR